MHTWMVNGLSALGLLLIATGIFFFAATRGALLLRAFAASQNATSHVYPIYSNKWLIKLVDYQPIISAILLFQYPRLVTRIVEGLATSDLTGKTVLITSCAFGNVIPRVTQASVDAGASRILIADVVQNELTHARAKLVRYGNLVEYVENDAVAMNQRSGIASANILFFLLHELPHPMKIQALKEAGRVLEAGGKMYLAEFHKPKPWVLKALSWTYFKVYEPLGLALWDSHDPVLCLEAIGGWSCERRTYFFGNFQVITATKL
ncbi:MAG: class I SAM-dependent methyltransferase [Rhodoferax sp.]|nr:class I SAM-dependent methyltransferase [Rhodoferax sp.]